MQKGGPDELHLHADPDDQDHSHREGCRPGPMVAFERVDSIRPAPVRARPQAVSHRQGIDAEKCDQDQGRDEVIRERGILHVGNGHMHEAPVRGEDEHQAAAQGADAQKHVQDDQEPDRERARDG